MIGRVSNSEGHEAYIAKLTSKIDKPIEGVNNIYRMGCLDLGGKHVGTSPKSTSTPAKPKPHYPTVVTCMHKHARVLM